MVEKFKAMGEDQLEEVLEDSEKMSRYEKALEDLADPLLPVRGHALIELTNLIETKDEATLKETRKVIKIFQVKR